MTIILSIKKALRSLAMLAVAAGVAFTAMEYSAPSYAEAGAKKKVKFLSKSLQSVGRGLEKAGRKAQKKRGAGKIVGGILKNTGKGSRKAGKGINRITKKASRGFNKVVSKSRTGGAAQKGWRKAQNLQNKGINKAFGKCRGNLCKNARDGVRLFAPM